METMGAVFPTGRYKNQRKWVFLRWLGYVGIFAVGLFHPRLDFFVGSVVEKFAVLDMQGGIGSA